MIDTNELRRLLDSTDMIDGVNLHANIKPIVKELLDRLEAAEKERDDVVQQLVRSEVGKRSISEAHEAVTSRLSSLAEENVTLRAKIEAMEKQEPVGEVGAMPGTSGFTMACFRADAVPFGSKLYALPGAKGE